MAFRSEILSHDSEIIQKYHADFIAGVVDYLEQNDATWMANMIGLLDIDDLFEWFDQYPRFDTFMVINDDVINDILQEHFPNIASGRVKFEDLSNSKEILLNHIGIIPRNPFIARSGNRFPIVNMVVDGVRILNTPSLPKSSNISTRIIKIKNLPHISEPQLKEEFSIFGIVDEVGFTKVVFDDVIEKRRATGFVSFQNKENAINAFEELNGHIFKNEDDLGPLEITFKREFWDFEIIMRYIDGILLTDEQVAIMQRESQ